MRIVAGRWGGRPLVSPAGCAQRPTQERVREALFASLGARVVGASVVDLFAGTGALGLEALSRGAERAVFVERSRRALVALRRNVEALEAGPQCRIVGADVFRFLGGACGRAADVSLLLADPPYGDLASQLAARLNDAPGLVWRPGALRVIEVAAREELWPPVSGWRRWSARIYGETGIVIEEREDPA